MKRQNPFPITLLHTNAFDTVSLTNSCRKNNLPLETFVFKSSEDLAEGSRNGSSLQLWVLPDTDPEWAELLNRLLSNSPFTFVGIILPQDDPDFERIVYQASAGTVVGINELTNRLLDIIDHGFRKLRAYHRGVWDYRLFAAREGFNQGAARLLHDINSPLTAVQSAFEMMEIDAEKAGRELTVKENLLGKGLVNSRKLTDAWHGLLFKQNSQSDSVDLYEAIRNTLDVMLTRHPEITFTFSPSELHPDAKLQPTPLQVPGSIFGYEQVFYYILQNAVEAVENSKEKKIHLSVDAESGPILINVEDSGPGVAEELAQTLWKDFQTTKREQGHQGMGLGIVRYILMLVGGSIRHLASESLGGACFQIELRLRR